MNKVKSYTDQQLLDRVRSLKSFNAIPQGIWILGVRSSEDTPDTFDDKFYIFDHDQFVEVISGTTNPGGNILKGGFLRFNKFGAFVLKSDECYYDCWKYIWRSSRGHELRQVRPMKGFRDGNLNGKSEEIGEMITGLFGINFHTNTFKWYNNIVKSIIGSWSAGCQVTNRRDHFLSLMNVFKNKKSSGEQPFVTYILLKEF
tara:strand:+ start:729 stop:1331 length:603 start_codon:yes stop_codon:yes gene_type:complete